MASSHHVQSVQNQAGHQIVHGGVNFYGQDMSSKQRIVQEKDNFGYREPVGICLGQAPLIDPAFFVGREPELQRMKEILVPSSRSVQPRRLALGGVGGVGKTQLAIAYTLRHRDQYNSAFWLNATTKISLEADFHKVARHIFGPSEAESLSAEQAVTYVHYWLSHPQNTRWLLIFDNYDDPSLYQLQQYYPPASHGTIVITTRRQDRIMGQNVKVNPLPNTDESVEILATRSQREDARNDPCAVALAKRLAGLPLALATAGAYLLTSHLTFDDYHRAYNARWEIDPYDTLELQEYQDRTLYTTWSLSYARLAVERPPAAQLLRLLAYFDNQSIWYELFSTGEPQNLPWLREIVTTEVQFDSIMRTLTNYCFVELQQSTRTWSMHNCVHDWTLRSLNEHADAQHYQYAFQCVASLIDLVDWRELYHASYTRLAAHAMRLIHALFWQDRYLSKIICDQFHHNCHAIAALLHQQGRLSEAEQMYVRALAGVEKTLGPNHISTLETMDNLGNLYSHQGKLKDSERMYVRALAGYEKTLGPDHTSTLNTINNFGLLYSDQGKLKQSEQMYVRALSGYEEALGSSHTMTLNVVARIGYNYRRQGKLEEAEQMIQRAGAGFSKLPNREDPLRLESMLYSADLYLTQQKFDEAKQIYQQIVDMCAGNLGISTSRSHSLFLGCVYAEALSKIVRLLRYNFVDAQPYILSLIEYTQNQGENSNLTAPQLCKALLHLQDDEGVRHVLHDYVNQRDGEPLDLGGTSCDACHRRLNTDLGMNVCRSCIDIDLCNQCLSMKRAGMVPNCGHEQFCDFGTLLRQAIRLPKLRDSAERDIWMDALKQRYRLRSD